MTNDELLKSIHQDNVDALPWQHASLRSIQKELGIARLWDSLFLFQPLQNDGDGEPLWKFEARDAEVVSIQVRFGQTISSTALILPIVCRQC